LCHVWQVAPCIRSRVPRDYAGADGEIDVASSKYPPAVVSAGGGSRTARRQICDRGPSVRTWIVAPGLVGGGVAAAGVNVVIEGDCHQSMVSERIVCSHRPSICGNIVNLDVEIGADSRARDAIDLAVEVSRSMEVSGDRIGWQARVVCIADRVVPPERGRRVEVLVHAAKQIDISAVGCAAEPASRRRK